MTLEIWAITLDFLGKFLLVVMALVVHKRIKKEGRIDRKVLKEMKWEQSIGFIALSMIVAAYIIELIIL